MEVIVLDGHQKVMEQPICSAIGFFDGLHIGHMALVNEVLNISKQKGYKSALITFDHQPLFILGKIKEEKYLTTMEDRQKILTEIGIDYLFIIHFTKEVAALDPQVFIQNYLISSHIQHVVCGFDFHFGSHNIGDVQTLKACDAFEVSVIDEVIYQGEKVSSSRIRSLLNQGEMTDMNDLLGHRYQVQGDVIAGRHIGHSIGFPTANIDCHAYFLPCNGVYAVKVYWNDQVLMGMCNIGYNPTFTALKNQSVEVNILDFDQNIYGEHVVLEFYYKMRNEKAFSNKEQLIEQLQKDQQAVRDYFYAFNE